MVTREIEITSAANPEIKTIRSLTTKKGRAEHNAFLSEGLRHVVEAVRGGWTLKRLVISTKARPGPLLDEAMSACVRDGGKILRVPPALMERIAKRDNAQAVIAVIEQRHWDLQTARPVSGQTWLGLEQVRDPGNLGSILRTADAFAVSGIILIGICCDVYSVETVRASMGSVANVAVYQADSETFETWHSETWKGSTLGTHLKGDVSPNSRPQSSPVLVLMGNEQAGLTETLSARCDHLVRIPMREGADSLNLAAATAIMLHQVINL